MLEGLAFEILSPITSSFWIVFNTDNSSTGLDSSLLLVQLLATLVGGLIASAVQQYGFGAIILVTQVSQVLYPNANRYKKPIARSIFSTLQS